MSITKHKNDRFKIVHGEVTRKVYAKQKADKRNSKPKKIASQATQDRKLKVKQVKRQKFLLKQKGKEMISNLAYKNAIEKVISNLAYKNAIENMKKYID